MIKEINDFIKKSLGEGKAVNEIKESLLSVGWKKKDIERAIKEELPKQSMGEIPLPHQGSDGKHEIVHIFINIASFLLLGGVATAVGILYFQIIAKYIPDALTATRSYYSYTSQTRAVNYSVASLIVSSPLYFLGIWYWLKLFKKDANKSESRITKWITYIVLLITGGTIVGDLISVLYRFLEGELTARFILRALVVFVVAGLIFGFYFFERKMVQFKRDIPKNIFRAFFGVSLLILISGIILGIISTGGPGQERDRKFDNERAGNLSAIANGISNFARDNKRLPVGYEEMLNNTRYSYSVSDTTDPETGESYEYNILASNRYELCAVFTLSNNIGDPYQKTLSTWQIHDSGRVCKQQTVTYVNNIPPPEVPLPVFR